MLLLDLQNNLGTGITPPSPVILPPASYTPPFGTVLQIITGALRFINEYAPGESIAADDASDALETLNDLLASWSTDQASVFGSTEGIFTYTAGQYRYTIGNYDAGTFSGTVSNGSSIITGATIPSDMIENGDLIGTGIVDGTYIINVNAVAGTVTMSNAATLSPGLQQIGYTVPGDFKMPRPLRITQAFTRITTQGQGLDYGIQMVSQERYLQELYKSLPAPWPILAWYNPTMPLGTLYFYQAPSTAAELHLFTDHILTEFTDLTAQVIVPQGYMRALKRGLARELAPEYGAEWTQMQERLYKESYDMIKSLNQDPLPFSTYDVELFQQRRTDKSWILTGGFR